VKFKKDILQEIVAGDSTIGEVIEDKIDDHDRWSVHHSIVFKTPADGRFFQTGYRVGATEYQDESPFEYDPEEIECPEVFPESVLMTVYRRRS
jgi:hypothetical protein